MILCSNPKAQYERLKSAIDQAIHSVLDSGCYVLGPQTKEFEGEFASYIGTSQAVGVGSGTEALHVALTACEIGPGDEVITVAHTAVATVAAIELAGATPVLIDIDPLYYTMDVSKLAEVITPRTKAIIPVHIYGQAADMSALLDIARRHKLRVIEDCAQCTGARIGQARLGSLGDIGCFSFYPTKNLGALGDGGMLVTNDLNLAQRARELREYGWRERHVSQIPGWNTRLDELQSAILRVKLRELDADNQKRAQLADLYSLALQNSAYTLPSARAGGTHVYHLFVVRCKDRDERQQWLQQNGVGALVHYPVPIHLQQAYLGRLPGPEELSETERAAKSVMSLPMYPELEVQELNLVVQALLSFETVS